VANAPLPPGGALPPGYGFTAGQLTCLRQQIMTFRKLKARARRLGTEERLSEQHHICENQASVVHQA
jgi:hypothetical protein